MKKTDLLYKLGESSLKFPKGLRKYIFNKTDYQNTKKSGTYFVDTLELWHEKLLMRSFAYRVPKMELRPFKMEIQEVCRRLEGEKQILLCQIENSCMGGRRVYFTDEGEWITRKKSDQYYAWYCGNKKSWWFYEYEMFDINEWILKLNIPYCGYNSPNYEVKLPFLQYVELYRKYPKIELLAKTGCGNLITGARYFDFDGKSFEQIFKIPKYWNNYLKVLFVSDILLIKKFKLSSIIELEIIKKANGNRNYHVLKYLNKKMHKYIENYNQDNIFPFFEYNDYLRMSEELGCNMNDNKVLYPRKGVKVAHDTIQKKYELLKTQKYNEGIMQTADKLKKYIFKSGNLIIKPVENDEELIAESIKLNHCVRTYAQMISEGETGIMLIRKKDEIDEPFVTLELKGSSIIQVRAVNNSAPPECVCQFVKKWEKKFQFKGY